MNPIKITAVSYYNTLPFIYGIKHSGILSNVELSLDVPSQCAHKLLTGEAEIGLIPVGALPEISDYMLIGSFCIGAIKDVKSVLLLANTPLESIKTIYLDTDSRTSVILAKILALHYWKINPTWKIISEMHEKPGKEEGMVLIGDKTFGVCNQYSYCYDLAGEWLKYTGLPFVFAVWISKNPLPEDFEKSFQDALAWGVDHRNESVLMADNLHITEEQLVSYLNNDISYVLDEQKREGMNLFLSYLSK